MSPSPFLDSGPNTIPDLACLHDYLDYYSDHTPQADAIISNDGQISYHDLKNKVQAYAKALLASGLKPGDHVATLSPPHEVFFVTFLAATSIGCTWLGLNPKYTTRELDYVIGDAAPRLIFSPRTIGDRNIGDELTTIITEKKGCDRLIIFGEESEADFLTRGKTVQKSFLKDTRRQVTPETPALIVYTSGTTGSPKGAVLSHKGLIHGAESAHERPRAHPALCGRLGGG